MLRNNCRKILTIRKIFGKHLRTWVGHAKFPISQICLRKYNLLQFNEKRNDNNCKDFYSNLAADLVNRLPAAKNIFGINFVKEYCSVLNIPSHSFKLQLVNKDEVFKILSNVDPGKACGLVHTL